MDQLRDFSDDRLSQGCAYCGAPTRDTRDHVPSRILLDPPMPDNLPVVWACYACNNGFSRDEEYVACLIECAIEGTTDPDKIARGQVALILRRSPALRARLESAGRVVDSQIGFVPEADRLVNVVRKLATGHALYELAFPGRREPTSLWCAPLALLSATQREQFESPQVVEILGEVGSRGIQRMILTEVTLLGAAGDTTAVRLLINDWVEVQEGRYRYFAADLPEGVVVRIVIAEYLGAEVWWAAEERRAAEHPAPERRDVSNG